MPMTSPHFAHIYQAFEAVAARRGDHTAVIYLGTRFTYRQVADLAERLAAALIDLGATDGRKVIVTDSESLRALY